MQELLKIAVKNEKWKPLSSASVFTIIGNMKKDTFLAIDLGAESGRAISGRIEDGILKIEEMHRFPTHIARIGAHLFWDAPAILNEIKKAISLVKNSPPAGIGVTTWGVDHAFVDRNGLLVGLPFHYRDSRTANIMDEVFSIVPKEVIFNETGIQFMPFNTLFQFYATKKEAPWILENASNCLFMPDLFDFWLTGARVNEFTIASTSQLYCPSGTKRNPRGVWTYNILEKLSLPAGILQETIPPGTRIGTLSPAVREETGLPAIPVYAVCGHDTASAVFSVPSAGSDWAYLSSGTWSLLGVELAEPIINEQTLKYNFTNEGGYQDTIRFLKNIMGLWILQECRKQWEAEANRSLSYVELSEMASMEHPFGAFIDANSTDFIFPGDMVGKIRSFCKRTKQEVPTRISEITRTILESLALEYRFHLERLEKIVNKSVSTIHIVGGGSQNKLLSKLTASATGKRVLCGPVEATAVGNIGVQMIAAGLVSDWATFRQIVRQSFPVHQYEPTGHDEWEKPYQRYCSLKGADGSQI
jgi:sugar (pentulose or hexulose) kinase